MSAGSPASGDPISRRLFLRGTALAAAGAALGGGATPAEAARRKGADDDPLRSSDPNRIGPFRLGSTIYRNPLRSPSGVAGFRLEGEARVSFPEGRMRLENVLSSELGRKSNFVYWFAPEFPASFAASWEFRVLREPGLCMVFFAARAASGGDIFGPGLAPRDGEYPQYYAGDIDTYHLSYFRRKQLSERAFHVCNVRKSRGFHLVAEGADPLPSVVDARPPYRIDLVKWGPEIAFFVDRLQVLSWRDDGRTYGPALGAGRFGFRQMAPLVAEYENFIVREVSWAA